VVATRRGGIRAQIRDGRSGLLLDDPRDTVAFGMAVARVLLEPGLGADLGRVAREGVRAGFLPDRHLPEWYELLARVVDPAGGRRASGALRSAGTRQAA
jgi:glycosyltransferase involved in cell wall biosynthesis